jgi:hypothetical protein
VKFASHTIPFVILPLKEFNPLSCRQESAFDMKELRALRSFSELLFETSWDSDQALPYIKKCINKLEIPVNTDNFNSFVNRILNMKQLALSKREKDATRLTLTKYPEATVLLILTSFKEWFKSTPAIEKFVRNSNFTKSFDYDVLLEDKSVTLAFEEDVEVDAVKFVEIQERQTVAAPLNIAALMPDFDDEDEEDWGIDDEDNDIPAVLLPVTTNIIAPSVVTASLADSLDKAFELNMISQNILIETELNDDAEEKEPAMTFYDSLGISTDRQYIANTKDVLKNIAKEYNSRENSSVTPKQIIAAINKLSGGTLKLHKLLSVCSGFISLDRLALIIIMFTEK